MEAVQITVEGDSSKFDKARERVNKGLGDMERAASEAARKTRSAFEAVGAAAVLMAKAAGGVLALRRAFEFLNPKVKEHGLNMAKLITLYRTARIALSPTIFTGVAIGAGIAVQATASLINARARLARQEALLAATSKTSFRTVSTFGAAERLSGAESGSLQSALSGFSPGQVAEIATQFRALSDPVDRARFAVEKFGDKAEQAMPLLERGLKENVTRAFELSQMLDGRTRQSIDSLGQIARAPREALRDLADGFRELIELAKTRIVLTVAVAVEAAQGAARRVASATPDAGGFVLGAEGGVGILPSGRPHLGLPSLLDIVTQGEEAFARDPNLKRLRGGVGQLPGSTTAEGVLSRFDSSQEGLQSALSVAKRRRDALLELVRGGKSGLAEASGLSSVEREITGLERQIKAPELAKKAAEEAARQRGLIRTTRAGLERFQGQRFGERVSAGNEQILRQIEQQRETDREWTNLRRDFEQDTEKITINRLAREEKAKEDALSRSHASELRALDGLETRTVAQKQAVEAKKLDIEVDFLKRSEVLALAKIQRETAEAIRQAEIRAVSIGASEEELQRQLESIRRSGSQTEVALAEETQAAVTAARENATNRQVNIQRDANQRSFDDIKRSASGLLDQLLSRTASFGDAVRAILRAALLTPLKEFASTFIAMTLTGQRPAGGGRVGGLLGLGLGGGVPIFGAGSITGGPGGTGGFSGPVGGGGGAGSAGGLGISALGGNARGILSSLGNIGFGPKGGDFGGEVAGSFRGVGGVTGGAMLLGGGILAAAGLQRGGISGLAMTTGGGALIGGKFGGPLGAAIGAGIGFGAGLVRLFIKGASEKAREKIRSVYGIDISDRGLLQQIVGTAKEAFGGNLDVAVRSPQIRDLVELYAMSTGQSLSGFGSRMRPVSLVQSGGSLFQNAGFFNGSSVPSFGGVPVLDTVGRGSSGGSGATVLQLDGPATTALLRGEVVSVASEQPRIFSQAATRGARASAGRREMTALQLSPGTLTS